MSWSADQYRQFEEQRSRPARDLLGQVAIRPIDRAVDLGCGPGNSTELLRDHFPSAEILGIDNSEDMVAAARKRLPATRFYVADIASWADPGPFDVILANASLQWVPDHAALLPRLAARISPGGCLAVQMPDNLDEPAHCLMREVAAAGPWATKLSGATAARAPRQDIDWYYDRLSAHFATVDIWRTTYHHPLAEGAMAVIEWFKGSGLRPFLAPLTSVECSEFLSRYRDGIEKAYPTRRDGSLLLPFPRLFFVASR